MGLYDTVELYDGVHFPEYPDNVAPPDKTDWQTKGIGQPYMGTYRITADGRLLEEEFRVERVPPEERPYAAQDDVEEGDMLYMAGSRRRIHEDWIEREDYHGRFRISTSFDQLDSLCRYEVTFTHGKLEGFERIE